MKDVRETDDTTNYIQMMMGCVLLYCTEAEFPPLTYRQSSPLWSAGSRALSLSVSGSCQQQSVHLYTVCQAGGCPDGHSTSAETCRRSPPPLEEQTHGGSRLEAAAAVTYDGRKHFKNPLLTLD